MIDLELSNYLVHPLRVIIMALDGQGHENRKRSLSPPKPPLLILNHLFSLIWRFSEAGDCSVSSPSFFGLEIRDSIFFLAGFSCLHCCWLCTSLFSHIPVILIILSRVSLLILPLARNTHTFEDGTLTSQITHNI